MLVNYKKEVDKRNQPTYNCYIPTKQSEVRKMKSYDIQMVNGIFSGKKIDELTKFIINKFAEERLNRDEAVEVLKNTNNVIGEFAIVKRVD